MKRARDALGSIPAGVPTVIAGLAMVAAYFHTEIIDWLDYVGVGLLGSGTHIVWTAYDPKQSLGVLGLGLSTVAWLIATVVVEAPPWVTHGEIYLMTPLFILAGLVSVAVRYLAFPSPARGATQPKRGSDWWAWLLIPATIAFRLLVLPRRIGL